MTAPNMATIAASLERSMQNCSLNHHHHHQQRHTTMSNGGNGSQNSQGSSHVGTRGRSSSSSSSTSDAAQHNQFTPDSITNEDRALELNSNVSLPYHWEQCLDLKTGEIYYINWRNGMKAKEDPRTTAQYSKDCYYSDDDDEDDDNSSYDSEESSTESSPSCSREREQTYSNQHKESENQKQDHVLVVAGCKSCLMYYMVPKQHEDCPKCSGQLLHFDRSETGSP